MRKAVTSEEVKKFKQAWYEALFTGKPVPVTFSGNRSETISASTQPHQIGIKDEAYIREIIEFRNLVLQVNLFNVTSSKYYSYLDEINLNIIHSFIEKEIVKDIIPFGAGNPVRDDKMSVHSPVVLAHVEFNKEKLAEWLLVNNTLIQSQIAEETEVVH